MRQSRQVYDDRWKAKKLAQDPDYFKKKYQEHKPKQSLRQKEYYKINRESVLAKASERYHAMTPEQRVEHNRKRRERHRRNPEVRNRVERKRDHAKRAGGEFRKAVWEIVCQKYNHSCIYCGSKENITVEHRQPVSLGGSNEFGNIAPACLSCNSGKRNKTEQEYIAWRKQKGLYIQPPPEIDYYFLY